MSLTTSQENLNFCFPIRELSNDRLKLTPFIPSVHAAEFVKGAAPYPEIWAHLSRGPFMSEQEYTSTFVQGLVQRDPGMILLAVIDKTRPATPVDPEGALAGAVTYMGTNPTHLSTEIGWVIVLPPFQRTHVTSNLVGLMLHYALDLPAAGGLGLRRVQWTTSTMNTASQRTAERLGFRKEGVLRWAQRFEDGRRRGKVGNGKEQPRGRGGEDDLARDTVLYSLCWDDWEEGGREKVQAIMDRR
ncbi:acyl-CoA N-acyltransferase [Gloeophyllum trabeum ATCC 11539]|uniref:Acyl-CoA N-acyltransferase n=1 Tax=Gloeophyllum trabeum (strain ATCC 11539 / FP-39264 / Madison 617) TaxID=670483 RepID=S7RKC6_GLOTA|nr:acyl-CoA N-acyltransferase [Gloeophyllum trabeum ATCC 11539]EPQ53104.1 acyl-CoA N-acyltransferase [Gloeophyllum trabeum ATCC 11539]